VVAIFAAAVAGIFSAIVALINGQQQLSLERERSEAQRLADTRKAEADRILEMIKTGNPDAAAQNLQFLIDSGLIADPETRKNVAAFLAKRTPGAGPSLPAANTRYAFDPTQSVPETDLGRLKQGLDAYIGYLDNAGFRQHTDQVPIHLVDVGDKGKDRAKYPGAEFNAYYAGGPVGIVIDSRLANDVDPLLREYTHHILLQMGGGASFDRMDVAIESAIADYFVCSYSNRTEIGLKSAEVLHKEGALPPDRNYLRTIRSDQTYTDLARMDVGQMNYEGARVWSSLLWQIRGALGQQKADRIAFETWRRMSWTGGVVQKRKRFALAILAATEAMAGKDDATAVRGLMAERKFPVAD
jgi:hypothetical protein